MGQAMTLDATGRRNWSTQLILAAVVAIGVSVALATPASAIYYSSEVTFTDAGCQHYGFSRYDSNHGNVKGYTMPLSSGSGCNYNGTAAHYAGITGSYTWGNGVVYYTAGASATGLGHSGGSVYKKTSLTTNPR